MKAYVAASGLLLLGCPAFAQKASDFQQFHDLVFSLVPGPERVNLYASLPDTLHRRPSLRLSRLEALAVMGEYSARWAVVRRNEFAYFIRQSDLVGLRPGQTARQAAQVVQAPLPLNERHLIDFTQVVEVPGASKNELYARGKVWFANTFQSARNAIQADDKEAGVLIGKGWQPSYYTTANGGVVPFQLWYTVRFAFKEGRYRYSLTDFLVSDYSAYTPSPVEAEGPAFATKGNGTPTNQAKAYTWSLSQSAFFTRVALELSMSKPAIGTDF